MPLNWNETKDGTCAFSHEWAGVASEDGTGVTT